MPTNDVRLGWHGSWSVAGMGGRKIRTGLNWKLTRLVAGLKGWWVMAGEDFGMKVAVVACVESSIALRFSRG